MHVDGEASAGAGSANGTKSDEGAIPEALLSKCGMGSGEGDSSHVHGACVEGEHDHEIFEGQGTVRRDNGYQGGTDDN